MNRGVCGQSLTVSYFSLLVRLFFLPSAPEMAERMNMKALRNYNPIRAPPLKVFNHQII